MIDETNIQQEMLWFYEQKAKGAIANFKRSKIEAQYVPDRKEALSKVMEMIPKGATVAWGDSVTLHQVGIISTLRGMKHYQVLDPFARDENGFLLVQGEKRLELMRQAFTADVFLTGVNAITLDGKLVSTDHTGNRVGPMVFGPKKVIVVAGANKIVKNLDEAIRRVREIASPINNRRHYIKHHLTGESSELPCLKTGTCADCRRPERACLVTVIIEGQGTPLGVTDYLPRMHVFIIGEQLGI